MDEKVLKKCINDIHAVHASFRWIGREFQQLGDYTAYTALTDDFEIVVAHTDSKTSCRTLDRSYLAFQGIKRDADLIRIELRVKDFSVRFGRKAIVDSLVFPSDHALFPDLQELFTAVQKIGIIFRPSEFTRLGADEAVLGFCKAISKHP